MLEKEQIDDLSRQLSDNPGGRAAQKALAHEVTKLVHGEERTASVERVTSVLFGGADFTTLQESDLNELASEIPVVGLNKSLVEVLVESGLASSNGEARRLMESDAVSVNSVKISTDKTIDSVSLVKKGKNSFVLVR